MDYGYTTDYAGIERDRQGNRIKRCPYCDRARQLSWSDVCRGCKKDHERQQAYYKTDEYKRKLKAYQESQRYIP